MAQSKFGRWLPLDSKNIPDLIGVYQLGVKWGTRGRIRLVYIGSGRIRNRFYNHNRGKRGDAATRDFVDHARRSRYTVLGRWRHTGEGRRGTAKARRIEKRTLQRIYRERVRMWERTPWIYPWNKAT